MSRASCSWIVSACIVLRPAISATCSAQPRQQLNSTLFYLHPVVTSQVVLQDMDIHDQLPAVVADGIAKKLTAHKKKEREHVEQLLASQKHLTSNVRTLMNSLDQVLMLSSPKFSSSQSDPLRSAVSRAKLLRKQLDTVGVRMQRVQVHLQGYETAGQAPSHQRMELSPQQRQHQQRQEQQQREQEH